LEPNDVNVIILLSIVILGAVIWNVGWYLVLPEHLGGRKKGQGLNLKKNWKQFCRTWADLTKLVKKVSLNSLNHFVLIIEHC
jgi:hypothetical protein